MAGRQFRWRNLQNIYGLLCRFAKCGPMLWTCFSEDGVTGDCGAGRSGNGAQNQFTAAPLEVAGAGGVLKRGEANDHHPDELPSIQPMDPQWPRSPRARGPGTGGLPDGPEAGRRPNWSVVDFSKTALSKGRADGKMAAFVKCVSLPKMKADYYQGWGQEQYRRSPGPGGGHIAP